MCDVCSVFCVCGVCAVCVFGVCDAYSVRVGHGVCVVQVWYVFVVCVACMWYACGIGGVYVCVCVDHEGHALCPWMNGWSHLDNFPFITSPFWLKCALLDTFGAGNMYPSHLQL